MVHQSHISSKRAKSLGWGRVPDYSVRAETKSLEKEVGTEFMVNEYLTLTASDAGCNTSSAVWTDTTTTGAYPYQTWVEPWIGDAGFGQYPGTVTIREIIKEKVVTKEVETRTLYRVYVVDPRKGGKILLDGEAVIALNENQAMLKVGIAKIASDIGREIEQLDVYVEEVGTFIRPRKETQKVKITKEDEED